MSKRFNNGSHYETHQRAAEMHEKAAHEHRAAEAGHGKQSHESGHEHSRLALEHSERAFMESQRIKQITMNAHGIAAFGHEETAILAHELWRARGYPEGSPEQDWSEASKQLRAAASGGVM